jgi:hypothetical protein
LWYCLLFNVCVNGEQGVMVMCKGVAWSGVLAVLLLAVPQAPAFAYWDDVHYYLTYYIARVVGYTPDQAFRVAAADLSVDYCEATEPTQMSAVDYVAGAREDTPEKQRPRWTFHAFRDETRFPGAIANDPQAVVAEQAVSVQLDALWQAAIGENSVNPGVYLHFVQDLGPHWGFGSAHGHYFDPADPAGSTRKAQQAGLAIGGTVDWLDFAPSTPYKRVEVMTASGLNDFLTRMSPRQQGRDWATGRVSELIEALRKLNEAPTPLYDLDFAPYIAYVKARHGLGAMPSLTAAQVEKFAKHSDGPGLNAAGDAVAGAMRAAGMIEMTQGGLRSHVEAQKQFTFDANGNVSSAQLDAYVLTGKLKVIVPATGAKTEPFVSLVIKAPPTMWKDPGYDLVPAPGNRQVPFSVTYEQIPVGDVLVELRKPVGDVLASRLVTVDKRWNEVTLTVASEEPGGYVLKPGFPQVAPSGVGERLRAKVEGKASESEASVSYKSEPNAMIRMGRTYQWTITGEPPKVLRPGDKFSLTVRGTAIGADEDPGASGGSTWWVHAPEFLNPDTGDSSWRPGNIPGAPEAPDWNLAYTFVVRDFVGQTPPTTLTFRWSVPSGGTVLYEWELKETAPPAGPEGPPQAPGGDAEPPSPAGGATRPGGPAPGGGPTSPTPPSGQTSEGLGMTVETKTGPDGKPMVVVAAANEDSPLAFLLQPGDAILAVDGVRIGSPGEFGKALAGKKAGDTVKLLVRRNDLEIELSMPFGEP